jgi:UDP-N-acetylglucosamine--N-acetylmuramyl-(pentapeptide) pyrophosphoryl-undecaprenol N-acetylglucosamine transferase
MIAKAVFAAGGTGGHIFPAIAVADELKKLNKNINIVFIGAKGRIEEKIVPNCGYELKTLEVRGFYRSISPKNLIVFSKFLKALREAKTYLKEFNPDLVYGTGGFVSGPVLMAAGRLGYPTAVQEGNYYPGITVKWLSNKVDKVILNFDGSKKFMKRKDNIEIMPYPVRENLNRFPQNEARKFFTLSENKKTLFAFGGSQGASSINNALLKNIDYLKQNDIQLIWQTGEKEYEKIFDAVKVNDNIKVLMFIENIDYAYSAADLIICRAGISTVMELAYFGAAVIFVPYAFASENHQEKNARAMVDAGAAEMVLDKSLEESLKSSIARLINDEKKLNSMRENIKKFADKNAASKIAELLVKLAERSLN